MSTCPDSYFLNNLFGVHELITPNKTPLNSSSFFVSADAQHHVDGAWVYRLQWRLLHTAELPSSAGCRPQFRYSTLKLCNL